MKPTSMLLYQVDAFTDVPFQGNPAAVCILTRGLKDSILQDIAAEMNLSETAFVRFVEKKSITQSHKFGLRWFTPKVEVPLCGHATLATAAVLFREIGVRAKAIRFKTKSGILFARRERNGIALDFPANPPRTIAANRAVLRALGIGSAGRMLCSSAMRMLLVHVPAESTVRRMKPDFGELLKTGVAPKILGVIVTAPGSRGNDFVSRFFAPWLGINEDPVTGSAHTVLGPYWSRLLKKKTMTAFQCSARGGKLVVRVKKNQRVEIVGNAVTVLRGVITVTGGKAVGREGMR